MFSTIVYYQKYWYNHNLVGLTTFLLIGYIEATTITPFHRIDHLQTQVVTTRVTSVKIHTLYYVFIVGVCNCSMFCCTLLYVHSSIAIILMGERELIALLNLSSWCLVMVERLFLAVQLGCLQFVIVVFPDHTHLLFLSGSSSRCHGVVCGL